MRRALPIAIAGLTLAACASTTETNPSRTATERQLAEARAERDEARRRRDEWRKKAEGFDEVRLALREKVGASWPPNMSRALWAGIAADEKNAQKPPRPTMRA